MESTKYLIVGGGVAGTTAATTIRKYDSEGRIVIVTNEFHPLYSRVALPAFTRDQTSRERVFLRDSSFYRQQRIELWSGRQAASLDIADRVVTLGDGERFQFEKLLIATGGKPRKWEVSGSHLKGVLPLRTIEQAEEIKRRLTTAKHAVVVGGGFISLEHIQTLAKAGVHTTVVIREPHYWGSVLDEESGQLLQSIIDQTGLTTCLYQTEVSQVVGNEQVESVILSNGTQLTADLVLVNIGINLPTEWLESSGLNLQQGIPVNKYLETDTPGIYAAGDVALFYDPVLGMHHHQGNWQNATNHGQVAGANMAGIEQPIEGVTHYSISLFGKNISFIGQTTKHLSMTVAPRGSARSGAYGRILIEDGKVVGATLINRFPDKEPISRLITGKVDVRPHLADLADETISLKDLADRLLNK